MADVKFDDFEGDYAAPFDAASSPHMGGRIMHVVGAITSVALTIGVGVWGYDIAVRNANGIPIVRAIDGPLRIAPHEPGGAIADHQGLSVNRIAAEGTAAPVAERLVLAPRSGDLTDEDIAGLGEIAPEMMNDTLDPVALPTADIAQMPQLAPQPAAANADGSTAAVLAMADELAAGATPLSAQSAEPLLAPATDAAVAAAMTAVVEGGVGSSLRPQRRPENVVARASLDTTSVTSPDASTPATASAEVAEIDPGTITAGTRLVQLGAFDTAEDARAEWAKLAGQFADLAGKSRVVEAAQSGGQTFFRLRAHGFADESAARSFCTTLLESNAACIPVAVR